MFADQGIARHIERGEALVTRAIVNALLGTARAPEAFLRELGPGFAAYVRPGSPMNKVIGVGLDEPIDDAVLRAVEHAFDDAREPVRAEIATLAAPATHERLTARGYRLIGFENVLARSIITPHRPSAVLRAPAEPGLAIGDARPSAIRVEHVTEVTVPAFREAVLEGSAAPDDTGVVADQHSHDVIATVIDDFLQAPGFARYVAHRDGSLAGGASMYLHDGLAMLTGSATLPLHRRRGVQAALLARRLDDARAAGASLAVITTSPGTQSQANVMKLGFSLMYARALLVRAA